MLGRRQKKRRRWLSRSRKPDTSEEQRVSRGDFNFNECQFLVRSYTIRARECSLQLVCWFGLRMVASEGGLLEVSCLSQNFKHRKRPGEGGGEAEKGQRCQAQGRDFGIFGLRRSYEFQREGAQVQRLVPCFDEPLPSLPIDCSHEFEQCPRWPGQTAAS